MHSDTAARFALAESEMSIMSIGQKMRVVISDISGKKSPINQCIPVANAQAVRSPLSRLFTDLASYKLGFSQMGKGENEVALMKM